MKYYRDLKNTLDTAKEEGKIEGLVEGELKGKIEVARKLIAMGLDDDKTSEITGLSIAEITNLRKSL